ncbi:MAG TPA: hypothetical protein DGL25_01550 [Dehalococcoidia bacterium]|nr:hypothetical protein [Dehalococcoidia bacterium]|tara:strand:+ start:2594 stop:3079 length:486 start_codon:yes stop_codon:yes gene_type:complete
MTALEPPPSPESLTDIERALLGVLCVGLPPARAAGNNTFRIDYVTAKVLSLLDGETNRHLANGRVTVAFQNQLKKTITSLSEAGILAEQPPDLPAAPGGYEEGLLIDLVEPDAHPTVLDRHLAQECMEALFQVKDVYPYLMERYSTSGEIWRRLRAEGYGQ